MRKLGGAPTSRVERCLMETSGGARAGLWATLVCLALGAVLSGCNESNVCGQDEEEILRADGGEYRCTQPEDCPRSSDVFVCETNENAEKSCVKCEETRCIRTIPISCGEVQLRK